ncbi:MAG: F0F1 ATP synthase subunit epsilon [Actinomycetota bacterium]
MRLQIVTPLSVEADLDGIVSVRADDRTGSFVVWPHHTDFITALAITVVEWATESGEKGHIAARGGIFRIEGGNFVQIATRQAISGPTLDRLSKAVLDQLRDEAEAEARTRVAATRLQLGLIRQLDRYLRSGRGFFLPRASGAFPGPSEETEAADGQWD